MKTPHDQTAPPLFPRAAWLSLGLVIVAGFFTYFYNYNYPQAFFWDENYYLTSAQKYLTGTFFMATHPPFGELSMALGEKLMDANPVDNQFIDVDYANELPPGFSFAGYRLFPVLAAWLAVPLAFGIFLLVTRRHLWALLLSSLLLFDTALIVHTRGAMLEGWLLFSSFLTILGFMLLREWRGADVRRLAIASIVMGFGFGLLLTVKITGLLLILLWPVALWLLLPDRHRIALFLAVSAASFAVAYVGVWQTHFTLARTINPKLHTEGTYFASEAYQQILAKGETGNLRHFPVMLRDNIRYSRNYHNGVPRLDLCKLDENGSPFFLWPIGARTINYRWESPNSSHYRYLYLVPNPATWWSGIFAVLVATCLLLASVLLPLKEPLRHRFLLVLFLGLYLSYMIAISRIGRVMYLYHYFLPLILSYILFAVVAVELNSIGAWKITPQRRTVLLLVWAFVAFLGFQFERPFAYYEPLTNKQFTRRALLRLWDMTCANCDRNSLLVVPTNKNNGG